MKKAIVSLLLVLVSFSLYAGSREEQIREMTKQNIPVVYNYIKERAMDKWDLDHEMILYEITEQCTSFFNVISKADTDTLTILVGAIDNWSYDDSIDSNTELIKNSINMETKVINIDFLLEMDVDWVMVEYTMNNQLEAQSKY